MMHDLQDPYATALEPNPYPAAAAAKATASEKIRWGRVFVHFKNIGSVVAVLTAVAGWATAAYMHFYYNPKQERIAYTKSRFDAFFDPSSPFQVSYSHLSEQLRPWFEEVQQINQEILATSDNNKKAELIRGRDESFLHKVSELKLNGDIERLVGFFDDLNECPSSLCDGELGEKLFKSEIYRFWTTFKPYIAQVRVEFGSSTQFGDGLEALYKKTAAK